MTNLIQSLNHYLALGVAVYVVIFAFALIAIIGSAISLIHALKATEKNNGFTVLSSIGLACGCLGLFLPPLLLLAYVFMFISFTLDKCKRNVPYYVAALIVMTGISICSVGFMLNQVQNSLISTSKAYDVPSDLYETPAAVVPTVTPEVSNTFYTPTPAYKEYTLSYNSDLSDERDYTRFTIRRDYNDTSDHYISIYDITFIAAGDQRALNSIGKDTEALMTSEVITVFSQYSRQEIEDNLNDICNELARRFKERLGLDSVEIKNINYSLDTE